MKAVIQALILSLMAAVAYAHTELSSSTPADEAVLDAAPRELVLHFSEPVRLTSVSIESGTGGKPDLGRLPTSASEEFSVELPPLPAGVYVVSWRALSADTHVMNGKLSFTVSAGHTGSHSGH